MEKDILAKSIIQIAKEASAIMLDRNFEVMEKGSASNIVTTKDIAVQSFLKDNLLKLIPGSTFLGEEQEELPKDAEYIWVVDPIDGTSNYARDLGLSVISIGLLKNAKQHIGVVFNPYRNEMFYAVNGGGAFLNGEKINVSKRPFSNGMLCSAMCLYDQRYAKECFNVIEKIYEKSDDLRRLGSAALELCYLAAGKVDLYFEIRLCPWDYCAGTLIIKEAGGYFDIMFRDKVDLRRPAGIIAANSLENFEEMKAIVYSEVKEDHFN